MCQILRETLFKKYVEGPTLELMTTLTQVLEKFYDKKKAEKVKETILKIGLKFVVLYKTQTISVQDFKDIRISFRRFCSCITNTYRFHNTIEQAIPRIISYWSQFGKDLTQLIQPHLSEILLEELKEVISLFSEQFFKFMIREEQKESLKTIVYSLHYFLSATRTSQS